jgi:hypothetical protein
MFDWSPANPHGPNGHPGTLRREQCWRLQSARREFMRRRAQAPTHLRMCLRKSQTQS